MAVTFVESRRNGFRGTGAGAEHGSMGRRDGRRPALAPRCLGDAVGLLSLPSHRGSGSLLATPGPPRVGGPSTVLHATSPACGLGLGRERDLAIPTSPFCSPAGPAPSQAPQLAGAPGRDVLLVGAAGVTRVGGSGARFFLLELWGRGRLSSWERRDCHGRAVCASGTGHGSLCRTRRSPEAIPRPGALRPQVSCEVPVCRRRHGRPQALHRAHPRRSCRASRGAAEGGRLGGQEGI